LKPKITVLLSIAVLFFLQSVSEFQWRKAVSLQSFQIILPFLYRYNCCHNLNALRRLFGGISFETQLWYWLSLPRFFVFSLSAWFILWDSTWLRSPVPPNTFQCIFHPSPIIRGSVFFDEEASLNNSQKYKRNSNVCNISVSFVMWYNVLNAGSGSQERSSSWDYILFKI
jgi:hypothetical protein